MPDEIDLTDFFEQINGKLSDPYHREYLRLERDERKLLTLMWMTTIVLIIGLVGYFINERLLQIFSVLFGIIRWAVDANELNKITKMRRELTVLEVMGQ